MPLILPGNVASATAAVGYDVANSCRFNDDDTASMKKTLVSPTSAKKFTYSGWLKRGYLGSGSQSFFSTGLSGDGHYFDYRFETNGIIRLNVDSAASDTIQTNAMFRDPAAWYHICGVVDTTDATEEDRIRLYVNGVRITSFNEAGYPTEDADIPTMVADDEVQIGLRLRTATQKFDGYMAEVCFIDGLALEPTSFGEFDSDSPTIWKPIDVSGLTFGNNGFYLDFEASDNLGNDANGGTDLTETNLAATDQATDTPTNNFCTLNPLDNFWIHSTFSEGNCQIVTDSSDYAWNTGTMAVSNGKWYYECKVSEACNTTETLIGISSFVTTSATASLGATVDAYGYYGAGHIRTNNGNAISSLSTYTANDIISVAFDLDNNKFYVRKNGGSWENSGDPTSGATGTGAQSITASGSQTVANNIGGYFPAVGDYDSTDGGTFQLNFGGCSAFSVSSGNADGNGYGNFEYAPPSGYYALCTKNLAEYG